MVVTQRRSSIVASDNQLGNLIPSGKQPLGTQSQHTVAWLMTSVANEYAAATA